MHVGLVVHIPHSSTDIPELFLEDVFLSIEELAYEIIRSTDAYCDDLFDVGYGEKVAARYSRLACDVERFRDDEDEQMAGIGNGLLYTHTQLGIPLRPQDAALRKKALDDIYDPHHLALNTAVGRALIKNDLCLLIDAHSFCDEPFVGEDLPDICIGTDEFHTPCYLSDAAVEFFSKQCGLRTALNYPYSGTIVPGEYYGNDKRVLSIMVEVNKRLYLKPGSTEKTEGYSKVKRACAHVVEHLLRTIELKGL